MLRRWDASKQKLPEKAQNVHEIVEAVRNWLHLALAIFSTCLKQMQKKSIRTPHKTTEFRSWSSGASWTKTRRIYALIQESKFKQILKSLKVCVCLNHMVVCVCVCVATIKQCKQSQRHKEWLYWLSEALANEAQKENLSFYSILWY